MIQDVDEESLEEVRRQQQKPAGRELSPARIRKREIEELAATNLQRMQDGQEGSENNNPSTAAPLDHVQDAVVA